MCEALKRWEVAERVALSLAQASIQSDHPIFARAASLAVIRAAEAYAECVAAGCELAAGAGIVDSTARSWDRLVEERQSHE